MGAYHVPGKVPCAIDTNEPTAGIIAVLPKFGKNGRDGQQSKSHMTT